MALHDDALASARTLKELRTTEGPLMRMRDTENGLEVEFASGKTHTAVGLSLCPMNDKSADRVRISIMSRLLRKEWKLSDEAIRTFLTCAASREGWVEAEDVAIAGDDPDPEPEPSGGPHFGVVMRAAETLAVIAALSV